MVLDLVAGARWWPIPVVAVLDEPAHLLTAWLALVALPPRRRPAVPWALLGAVAIDVDHVPLYLWHVGTATESGRPVTHCLLSVVVFLCGARLVRRARPVLAGLAVGVALHLVRDLATGPGVPLLWPASGASVSVPHAWYLEVLVVLAAVAARRRSGAGQRPGSRNSAVQGRL